MVANKRKWIKIQGVAGLRFRIHPDRTRKKGIKIENDVLYQYRHTVDGRRVEENIGWLFEGMTLEKAITRVYELRENKRHGTGPATVRAKRAARRKLETETKKTEAEQKKQLITFAEIWEKYLPISKATKKNRRGWMREIPLFERYIKPVIGNMPLSDIKPLHLERIKKNMTDLDLAPRTITYALAVTRQVFNFAIRNNIYNGKNPVSDVKKPTSDNKRTRFFSQTEAEKLLKEFQKKGLSDVYGMTLLSFRCGLRAAETVGLTWGSVDFENEQIHIMDTKSGRDRFAFMTADVKDWFSNRLILAKNHGPDDYIFIRDNGTPYLETPKIFQKTVNDMGFNDGVTDRRHKLVYHSCRHSFASWHAADGTDLHILQKLLGHETFSMVLRYAHLKPDTLKAAVKRLENHQAEGADVIPMNGAKGKQ